jgi:hypothetical protein
MRRAVGVAAALVVIGVAVVVGPDEPDQPSGAAMLPDLWSSPPFELRIEQLDDRAVLRFTSEINNAGPGPFLVTGNARDGGFTQHVAHESGGTSTTALDVGIVWGGDTHYHWHIEDVARYWIERADQAPMGDAGDNKVGFCFFDGVDRQTGLDSAPPEAVHPSEGCGDRLDPSITMGLSVGWGDQYRYDLEGQFIDIEDLPSGQYVLKAEVDPDGRFAEIDRTNNIASTPFTLIVDESGGRTLIG